jgi:hypothetical protein
LQEKAPAVEKAPVIAMKANPFLATQPVAGPGPPRRQASEPVAERPRFPGSFLAGHLHIFLSAPGSTKTCASITEVEIFPMVLPVFCPSAPAVTHSPIFADFAVTQCVTKTLSHTCCHTKPIPSGERGRGGRSAVTHFRISLSHICRFRGLPPRKYPKVPLRKMPLGPVSVIFFSPGTPLSESLSGDLPPASLSSISPQVAPRLTPEMPPAEVLRRRPGPLAPALQRASALLA